MSNIDRYRELKSRSFAAGEFLRLIGKSSVSATAKHVGSISKISVKTEIHYQAYDGATNYHENSHFDAALAEVVRSRFSELSVQAIELMRKKTREAAIAAKADLEILRGEFDAICEEPSEPA